MRRLLPICLLAVALPFSVSAVADVKDGVDAWSRGDFKESVKQWRDPANKGDPDAQFNMAQAYKLGRGVKQDLNIAADWYAKAAKQGHLQAADSYGHLLHYQGKVVAALPYLQASSERGEPRAQYLLATELFNGVHLQKDWVGAYAYMTRASATGLAPASRSLAEMDKHIPLDQRQKGIVMAGEIEKKSGQIRAQQIAGFPINTKPPVAVATKVEVPASKPGTYPDGATPGFPGTISPIGGEPAEPVKPAKVAAVSAVTGKWRIQLGAFGSDANANNLWRSLTSKVAGLSAYSQSLSPAGQVKRLQAGPFASRADADAMCNRVKSAVASHGCIVVAP
jgi:uncharacterized protein